MVSSDPHVSAPGIGHLLSRRIAAVSLLTLIASVLSPPVAADCSASAGAVDVIEEDGVEVTCNVDDPNPFTTGVGSTSTNTNLTVSIESDAGIESTDSGVRLGDGGELDNGGSVRATLEAVLDTAVDGSGSVSISNSGSLTSTSGITVDLDLDDADVDNSGSISGVLGGIRISEGGVINSGDVSSSDTDGFGIQIGADATLDNSGTLSSTGIGVISGARAAVTNTGTITGASTGVLLDGEGTLENSGIVISEAATAIVANGNASIRNSGRVEGAEFAIELLGGDNTLTLDSGSDLTGTVVSRAGLTSDRLILAGSSTEDAGFENFETLTMQGESWTLSGRIEALDATVQSGQLTLNGLLDTRSALSLPGTVQVLGGTLTGSGRIIGDLENSAGTVRVGRESLTLTGDFQQLSGGSLRVGEGTGGIGQLLISGTADLAGELVIAAGSDTVADVLTAEGGISGDFSSIRTDGRAQVAVSVGSNSVRIVRASTTVQDNQIDAALDSAYLTLDNLSGGVVNPSEGGLWARALGHYGDREERDELPGGDWWITGAMVGGDFRLGQHIRIGAALGHTRTKLDVDDGSEVESDNLIYGAYLDIPGERVWGTIAIAGGSTETDQSRILFVEGSEDFTSTSFDGSSLGIRAGIGGRMGFNPTTRDAEMTWLFEPSLLLDYVVLDQDPYTEVGGSGINYATDEDIESLQLSGLLTVRRPFTEGDRFSPRFYLGVVHRGALDDRAWTAADPATDLLLQLEGDDSATTNLGLGAGTDFRLGRRFTGFFDWRGEIGKHKKRHLLMLGVRLHL